MEVRKFKCLQPDPCIHYRTGHLIDNTTLVGNVDRMENCTHAKVNSIVGVIRAILNEEMNREGPYVGLNIFQDSRFPNRVFYGRSHGEFYDEHGNINTSHFLEFETPAEAAAFTDVLQGVLMLSLTRFVVNSERFIHHHGYYDTVEFPAVTN